MQPAAPFGLPAELVASYAEAERDEKQSGRPSEPGGAGRPAGFSLNLAGQFMTSQGAFLRRFATAVMRFELVLRTESILYLA